MKSLRLLVFLASSIQVVSSVASIIDMHNLKQHIFNNSAGFPYDPELRPAYPGEDDDTDTSTAVEVDLHLRSLVDVDEKSQSVTLSVQLDMKWHDRQLMWEPGDWNNLNTLVVKQSNLWVPDVIVANSVVVQSQMGYPYFPVRLLHDGYVNWRPSLVMTTSCEIVVTYYPFDTQVCTLDFQMAVSTDAEVMLKVGQVSGIGLEFFTRDGSWILEDSSSQSVAWTANQTKLRYKMVMARRTTFYVTTVILPVLLLSITASLVFALPADSGEKMGTSITVLLAFAVYLTIVSDYLPNTSLNTSILAIYLTTLLAYTALSVVTSVLVLRLHHRPDTHKVTKFYNQLTLTLKVMTCNSKEHNPKVTPMMSKVKDAAAHEETMTRSKFRSVEINDVMSNDDMDHHVLKEQMPSFSWQEVAETLDWFCFLLYTGLIALTTVVTLMVLVLGGAANKPTLDDMI